MLRGVESRVFVHATPLLYVPMAAEKLHTSTSLCCRHQVATILSVGDRPVPTISEIVRGEQAWPRTSSPRPRARTGPCAHLFDLTVYAINSFAVAPRGCSCARPVFTATYQDGGRPRTRQVRRRTGQKLGLPISFGSVKQFE